MGVVGWGILPLAAQPARPMIWVRDADRAGVLDRIANYPDIAAYYDAFTQRVDAEVSRYATDPQAYLQEMPFAWEQGVGEAAPPLLTYTGFRGPTADARRLLLLRIQTAVDGGVLYWLTGREDYARYAADVLHNLRGGLLALQPSEALSNGGWLYPEDHLREAREIGAQLPIIYDFIYSYLRKGASVNDVGTLRQEAFDFVGMQEVFRTYVRLAAEHGHSGSNWSVLEMGSMLGSALALDDPEERQVALRYVLQTGTDRQDALPTILRTYTENGGFWPESINYTQGVAGYLVYFYTILHQVDPTLEVDTAYQTIMGALPHAYALTYPDGRQTILFGDGHRPYRPQYTAYEIGHALATRTGRDSLRADLGSLIATGTASGDYRRFQLEDRSLGASVYYDPVALLWYTPTIGARPGSFPLPVTHELPFAGLTLQRNLSATGRPTDALMTFVGGGSYVHGHASGMNAEFYGQGHVLGSKAGRGIYRTEIHENYYRLFASHNTVIANGASRGQDDWVNLGIDRVRRTHVEPAPDTAPLSAGYSFQINTFSDSRGGEAGGQSTQERTLGIVRTSDTTGFYVDVHRSRSERPDQYHDYVYHNIGDTLALSLPLHADSLRYRAAADQPWVQNRAFRNPGWHYFEQVRSSDTTRLDVTATFTATALDADTIRMHAFVPGHAGRTYTTALAPPTTETPPYEDRPTPTLVVRQEGEAWTCPFTAVYHPTRGPSAIASVTHLGGERGCNGIRIVGTTASGEAIRYVLTPPAETPRVTDDRWGIDFTGRYAVVTVGSQGELRSVYVGSGQSLTYGETTLSVAEENAAAYVDFSGETPEVQSASALTVTLPGGEQITFQPTTDR